MASKKKRKEVETISARQAPSTIKTRSSTKKEKGKNLELEEKRIEQSDEENNPNEPLHSHVEEDLQKPPEVPIAETPVSRKK